MTRKNHYIVKTLTGNYYMGEVGYDNTDLFTDPVRLNDILIPLSNIDYIRFGLTKEEADNMADILKRK